MGGIRVEAVSDFIISFDGTLIFSDNIHAWPTSDGSNVLECFHFINIHNVTFTSSGKGTLNGNGGTSASILVFKLLINS